MQTLFRSGIILLLVLATSTCSPGTGSDEPAEQDPSLIGSWRLTSWTVGGAPRCGPNEGRSSGQIMYSADGHMSAQLGCGELSMDDLADFDPGQVVAHMQRRHFSYYGTYTLDREAGTVTHHVLGSSSASWVGTDRVRSFVFEDPDRVRLSTIESDNELVWVRN